MQKQLLILTVRRIQSWLQNTPREASKLPLNFNIVRTKVMKNSLMTSTIYSVSYGIQKKNHSPTQEKRKQERTKTQASKKFILACQQLKVV